MPHHRPTALARLSSHIRPRGTAARTALVLTAAAAAVVAALPSGPAGGADAAVWSAGASRSVAAGRVTGLDVARYQHPTGAPLSWTDVARTEAFVFVKASGGTDGPRSPWYAADAAGARAAGMAVGAYHFATPSRPVLASARTQAAQFAAVTGRLTAAGWLPPVLDLEKDGGLTPAELVTWSSTWASEVTRLTGRTPMLYTAPYFFSDKVGRPVPGLTGLWIADYGAGRTSPRAARGLTGWSFWQVSSSGSVAGVPGKVDVNVFAGTRAQLDVLARRRGSAPAATAKAKAGVLPRLRRGSRGTDVRWLQAKLKVKVTGTFDAATDAAVRRFQKARRIAVDGIVGPNTWRALGRL